MDYLTNEATKEEHGKHTEEERLRREIEKWTKAIETNPSNYGAYLERGRAYKKMEEMEKAAKDFEIFLLADHRVAKVGTTPWGFLHGAIQAAHIGSERGEAQSVLRSLTK